MKKIESFYTSFKEGVKEWDFYKFEVYEDGYNYNQLVNHIHDRGYEYEICRYSSGYATIIIRTEVNVDIRKEMWDKFSEIKHSEFEGQTTLRSSNLYRIFKRLESF